MARKKRKRQTRKTKTETKKTSTEKKKKGEIKVLELMSDGEKIPLKAEEIISVEVLTLNRPKGIAVENYTYKQGVLRLAIPLPTPERIRIKYRA